jgi:hypothetical protein
MASVYSKQMWTQYLAWHNTCPLYTHFWNNIENILNLRTVLVLVNDIKHIYWKRAKVVEWKANVV